MVQDLQKIVLQLLYILISNIENFQIMELIPFLHHIYVDNYHEYKYSC